MNRREFSSAIGAVLGVAAVSARASTEELEAILNEDPEPLAPNTIRLVDSEGHVASEDVSAEFTWSRGKLSNVSDIKFKDMSDCSITHFEMMVEDPWRGGRFTNRVPFMKGIRCQKGDMVIIKSGEIALTIS